MAACRKEQFASPDGAERQMGRLATAGKVLGQTARAYQCPECGMWHWGHQNRQDKAVALLTEAHQKVKWPPQRRGPH